MHMPEGPRYSPSRQLRTAATPRCNNPFDRYSERVIHHRPELVHRVPIADLDGLWLDVEATSFATHNRCASGLCPSNGANRKLLRVRSWASGNGGFPSELLHRRHCACSADQIPPLTMPCWSPDKDCRFKTAAAAGRAFRRFFRRTCPPLRAAFSPLSGTPP